MHLIGLDVGTTGCKAVVFDRHGVAKGRGFREYGIIADEPKKAEQDAEAIWRFTLEAVRDAIAGAADSGVASTDIGALSLSVQGDAIIPVDADAVPVHNAVLGMDYRSEPQARACVERWGDRRLFELTGMRSHPINALTKIMWLRTERPHAYRRATRIVTYSDFILMRLGAPPVIDHTMASRTMAFDLAEKKWSEEILGGVDIDPGKLSESVPSGTIVGTMSPTVASFVGASDHVALVTGGHDQTCAATGAGLTRPGIGLVSTGTAEVFSTACAAPALGTEMFEGYYPCHLHAAAGMYFTFALNHVGGLLLTWFRDTFSPPEVLEAAESGRSFYALMDEKAPGGPVDLFVLPHLNGSGTPWCDMGSRGAFVGMTMATSRHDLYRAMLESQAYELLINVDRMVAAGMEIGEIRAAGGGASSTLWLQIKADVLDREVWALEQSESACLGAALLAGTATGVYSDLDQAVADTVRLGERFEPRSDARAAYAEKSAAYSKLYTALKPVFAEMGESGG